MAGKFKFIASSDMDYQGIDMSGAVSLLEALFEKAHADLHYVNHRLDSDFNDTFESCPKVC